MASLLTCHFPSTSWKKSEKGREVNDRIQYLEKRALAHLRIQVML